MERCPICNRESKPRIENEVAPFCSPRCKTIDLGKWLNEEYRVPAEESGDGLDEDEEDASQSVRH